MILYINSTAHENVTFMLNTGGKTITKTFIIGSHSGHKIVKNLEEFLKNKLSEKQLRIKDKGLRISEIIVNTGPGSFVGTRVGVTIAQALAMVWNVPVKYLENEEFIRINAKHSV